MKKTLIVLFFALLVCGSAQAQKIKLGHINSEEIMQIMPGRDTAQATLEREMQELQKELKDMQTELETRYNDYVAKKDNYSDLIRKTKESELNDMNLRVQEFAKNAERQMQDRQSELIKPIVDRLKQAISDVAKENGYTYIFDVQTLHYFDESDDISPLVKKKLGL